MIRVRKCEYVEQFFCTTGLISLFLYTYSKSKRPYSHLRTLIIDGIGKRVFSPLFYPLLIGVDIFKAFTQRLLETRSVSTCTFYWLKKEYICPQDYSL